MYTCPARGLKIDDLQAAPEPVDWLWRGFLARRNVTLLTSQWKSGKTTLLSVLLDRLRAGGLLAGLEVRPARALIVSEEDRQKWNLRATRLGFGPHLEWFCRPFRGKTPTLAEWRGFLGQLLVIHQAEPFDLVAVDSLAYFLPGRSENNATTMLEALAPLHDLAEAGPAVLLIHHPRKEHAAEGCAARGSGALTGFADILLEMNHHGRASGADRRRRLVAFSRFEETPRQLVIEVNAALTDYASLGDFEEHEANQGCQALRQVLAEADHKLTHAEILAGWPAHLPTPTPNTLWRWLDAAAAQQILLRGGTGRKNDPYRYYLPGQPEQWYADDPLAALREQSADDFRKIKQQWNIPGGGSRSKRI